MLGRTYKFLAVIVFLAMSGVACSSGEAPKNSNASATSEAKPVPTPRNNFTAADIAKLKWIEGTWRGIDGDKPFYERYKVEETALVVTGLKEDGSDDGEPGRFELKNGEFGKDEGDRRSAASEITEKFIQIVPAPGSPGNMFRFEQGPDGTWNAVLEWQPSKDKPARQKTYKMERWLPPTK